jgi:hypothetical protein
MRKWVKRCRINAAARDSFANEERKMLATKTRRMTLPKRKRTWTCDEMVAELEETNQPTALLKGFRIPVRDIFE